MNLLSKVAICTACDSRYFKLAKGLIESVLDEADSGDESLGHTNADSFPMLAYDYGDVENEDVYSLAMCVIDCGLEQYELDWLVKNGVKIIKPENFTLPVSGQYGAHMFGFLERHNLPKLFEGYDIYMWMDADTWVQDYCSGMVPFLRMAYNGHVAIVPEYDRCYAFNQAAVNHSREWAIGNYGKFFGQEVAVKLGLRPMFNGGVFAVRGDSPFWLVWESAMHVALLGNNGKPDFGIDQIALNFVLHQTDPSSITVYPLPATCNWAVTHAMPVRSDIELLCEPLYPFDALGIIHMMDNTKWNRMPMERVNKTTGKTYSGDAVHMDFGYWKKNRIAYGREFAKIMREENLFVGE